MNAGQQSEYGANYKEFVGDLLDRFDKLAKRGLMNPDEENMRLMKWLRNDISGIGSMLSESEDFMVEVMVGLTIETAQKLIELNRDDFEFCIDCRDIVSDVKARAEGTK